MAKTVNRKTFWAGWSVLVFFLGLLCAVVCVVLTTVGYLLNNPIGGYLTSGLLVYMANPRYWTLDHNRGIPYKRDIWVLFLWPFKLPFYVFLAFATAVYRLLGK